MKRGPGVLLVWIVACVAATAYAAGWSADNRIARWVAQLGPDAGWEILLERFGGDEIALLRVRAGASGASASGDGPGIDSPLGGPAPGGRAPASALEGGPEVDAEREDSLRAFVVAAAGELESDPAVASVAHPWSLGGGAGAALADLAERPAIRALDLIGAQPMRADLLVLVHSAASTDERAALARRVERLEQHAARAGHELLWAGHPLVAAALDLEARLVEVFFAPLLVVVAAIGVGLLLRSAALAVFALLPAILISGLARGGLRAAGVPADLILVTAGPLAFVILFASGVHVVCAWRHRRRELAAAPAARAVRRESLAAGALAGLTTAAGFAAFTTSGLRSVALLGLVLALAIPAGVALLFAGLPPLLGSFDAGARTAPRHGERRSRRTWRRLAGRARRQRVLVGLALIALFVATPFAVRALGTDTDALAYFPPEHPAPRHFAALEAEGTALSTVDVLARAGAEPWTPGALDTVGLGAALAGVDGVTGVFGPEVVMAEVRASAGPFGVALAPGLLREAGRLDPEGQWARWTARFPTLEREERQALIERVRTAAGSAEDAGAAGAAEVIVTGSVPRMLAMQPALLRTLAVSLGLTIVATSLLLVLVARSARELFAAVVTNLVPVAAVFCGAALFDIPLDGATVIVAALVLGLAVDNTIHLLHAGRARGSTAFVARRRLRAFDRVGAPCAISSAALILGFALLSLSGFAPTARFGLLCAIGAGAALVADLVVLPALWVPRPRAGP